MKHLYDDLPIQLIANALRKKTGTQRQYRLGDMAQAILDLPSLIFGACNFDAEAKEASNAAYQKATITINMSFLSFIGSAEEAQSE